MLSSKFILVNHWIHLSAAGLLVGGMVFLVVILRPALVRSSTVSGVMTLADDIHDRFRKYVGILIGVIIFSGFINFLESVTGHSMESASVMYVTAIRLKVALAICLFIIYGINAFLIKEPKANKGESCSCVMQPPIYKRVLQIMALVLVFAILFLSVILRNL
ncbi:MAG: hypothetical protein D8M57_19620 [Candidatus Scalindua sp. AMX11]|nr:MAG: hypothetical protein DWQ00_03205 [Candidatus Scalindua sp.]NOG82327.1 hypothetical protein [Planctomycetota bacterium]RZV66894.1 MAG: hypothetical protein EX341_17220 [Candidatus Scalindua sp. SCAELEC01]TDE63187.1 MAG: hypothetical protein D8M57_19620 [Candidatus Scalindua sp. AMX11]